MIQELQSIKEQLFDASSEVKEAFNTVVGYFDDSEVFYVEYKENGEIKRYKFKAKDKKDAEKILKDWKRDYPDWIDYKTAKIIEDKTQYWIEKYIAYSTSPEKVRFQIVTPSNWMNRYRRNPTWPEKNLRLKGLPVFETTILEGPFNSENQAEKEADKLAKSYARSNSEIPVKSPLNKYNGY